MAARAFITGLAGPTLTADERAFLREARPGASSCSSGTSRTRTKSRAWSAKPCSGRSRDAPVLVDQEGGRVQRLGPPHWPAYPPGAAYGALYDRDPAAGLAAARLGARLIAADLMRARHQCRLPAARRRSGPRRRPGDRRPRLWRDAGQGRGASPRRSPRACWTAACCRCSSTSPATAAPTPTATSSCRWCGAARPLEATRFCRISAAEELPLGMTAHVVFTRLRSRATCHHFGHNDPRSDSRLRSVLTDS